MLIFKKFRLAALALIALLGCSQEVPGTEEKVDRNAALREWSRNEAVLAESVKGKIDTDGFLKSVLFFYQLTGISVGGEGTPFGFLPNEKTKEDLVRLKEWCELHCDEIYWDEMSQKVKRLPGKG